MYINFIFLGQPSKGVSILEKDSLEEQILRRSQSRSFSAPYTMEGVGKHHHHQVKIV